MVNDFFPQRPNVSPKIYAYTIDAPTHKGLLKIGYTRRAVPTRVKEQLGTSEIVEDPSPNAHKALPCGLNSSAQ